MAGKMRRKSGRNRKSKTGAGILVQEQSQEGVDISVAERIVRIARPFIAEVGPGDDRDRVVRSILGFAVAAWNSALMTPEQGHELLSTVSTVPGLTVAELDELRSRVEDMAVRRRELYPEDRRYVDNYRFSGEGAELRFEARVLPG